MHDRRPGWKEQRKAAINERRKGMKGWKLEAGIGDPCEFSDFGFIDKVNIRWGPDLDPNARRPRHDARGIEHHTEAMTTRGTHPRRDYVAIIKGMFQSRSGRFLRCVEIENKPRAMSNRPIRLVIPDFWMRRFSEARGIKRLIFNNISVDREQLEPLFSHVDWKSLQDVVVHLGGAGAIYYRRGADGEVRSFPTS